MINLPAPKKFSLKRPLALILACIAVLALTVPALACGHGHHGGKKSQTQVTVCTVKNCDKAGRHTHNGVTYCGGANHHNSTCDGSCYYCAQQSAAPAATHHPEAYTTPQPSASSTHHSSSHHGSSHH